MKKRQSNDLDEDRLFIDRPNKKVTYQPSNPDIGTLYSNYKDGELVLDPDFQRNFVWTKQRASNLIESIVLNVPLPIIFTAELGDREEVVDGQQRLTSIFSYIDGQFPDGKPFKLSKNLKILHDEIGGKSYKQLDKKYKRVIKKRALPFITIAEESHEDVKFEMFERLNKNVTPLNAQELRNCLYRGPYNDLLRKISEYKDFQYIINKPNYKKRMVDVELALMFCAFFHTSPEKYKHNLTQMLNIDMRKYQLASEKDLDELEKQFKKSVKLIKHIWGKNAFNIYSIDQETKAGDFKKPLNQGLFQILMYWFIPYKANQVIPYTDLIKEELFNLQVHDDDFMDTLEGSGTNSPRKIRKKFHIWGNTLTGILKYPKDEPRSFSYKLKKQLWKKSDICQICSQKISTIDDAEVDHIICYWKGGKTVPKNARLTHRLCNRIRGGAKKETVKKKEKKLPEKKLHRKKERDDIQNSKMALLHIFRDDNELRSLPWFYEEVKEEVTKFCKEKGVDTPPDKILETHLSDSTTHFWEYDLSISYDDEYEVFYNLEYCDLEDFEFIEEGEEEE